MGQCHEQSSRPQTETDFLLVSDRYELTIMTVRIAKPESMPQKPGASTGLLYKSVAEFKAAYRSVLSNVERHDPVR